MRVAGVSLLVLLVCVALVPAREPTKPEFLLAVEKQLKSANQTAGPAVACVVVSRSDRYPKSAAPDVPGKLGGYDPKEFRKQNAPPGEALLAKSLDLSNPESIPDHGYACGVVIDPSGLILTPYHVVEGATKVYVHLPGRVGSYADIHAADTRHDLAVLKLLTPPHGLTAIKFADVRLEKRLDQQPTVVNGKLVILMANSAIPGFAVDKPSAALGSVTGIRTRNAESQKELSPSYYLFGPLLEHDAKLNAGVDGAALLNLDGELIGLTTTTANVPGGERGAAYAFPTDDNFRRVVAVLRRGEEVEYGYLGVKGPATGPSGFGVLFGGVSARGPAATAGLIESPPGSIGDLVTHVNGAPTNTYGDLLLRVGSALAGEKVTLTVSRDGRVREVEVTLAKFKNDQPFIASVRPDPVFGLRVDYNSILSQQKEMGDARLQANGVPAGVCVRELTANSPAATAFKKLGDDSTRWLITHVNGAAVATPAEFYKAAKGQQSVKLTVKDPTELNARDREVTLP